MAERDRAHRRRRAWRPSRGARRSRTIVSRSVESRFAPPAAEIGATTAPGRPRAEIDARASLLDRLERGRRPGQGTPSHDESLATATEELDAVAGVASSSTCPGLATEMTGWAIALRRGTAPLDADAQRLVQDFADLERVSGSKRARATPPTTRTAPRSALNGQRQATWSPSSTCTFHSGSLGSTSTAGESRVPIGGGSNSSPRVGVAVMHSRPRCSRVEALGAVSASTRCRLPESAGGVLRTRGSGALAEIRRENADQRTRRRGTGSRRTAHQRPAAANDLRQRRSELGSAANDLLGIPLDGRPEDALRFDAGSASGPHLATGRPRRPTSAQDPVADDEAIRPRPSRGAECGRSNGRIISWVKRVAGKSRVAVAAQSGAMARDA